MGFKPSIEEQDIWMRETKENYEYISVYVDDLSIAANDPYYIIKELTYKHKFNLKGTGPISYHLGMDFYRDSNGILCMGTET